MSPAAKAIRSAGRRTCGAIAAWLALLTPCARADDARSAPADPYEEAQTTASRRPSPVRLAPATVYVITSDDIRESGVRTIWDALRSVPGADVLATRASHAEVSIRGFDQPLANRTLVLLDGRTVLNGYFDNVIWEEIPVTLEEVDRIEVVEGPVSALYGANAVNGVINIITKRPDQLRRGTVRATAGERALAEGAAVFGARAGAWSGKFGAGWRTVNQFEDPDRLASRVLKAHGLTQWEGAEGTAASVSGGLAGVKTQLTTGNNGTVVATGPTGFVRADAEAAGLRSRVFWNRSRQVARELLALSEPAFDYDIVDATLGYGLALPFGNLLDVGTGYRVNAAESGVFRPGVRRQSLGSVFGEDQWTVRPGVTAVASGRLDHHPFTGWVSSPRGSVIVEPRRGDAIRLSGGRSFRNPTIMQNELDFTQRFENAGPLPPNPPFTVIESRLVGDETLKPERMTLGEAAYTVTLGPLRSTLVGFTYRLEDVITTSDPRTSAANAPVFSVRNSYQSRGDVEAWGGEAALEARVRPWLTLSGNYSHAELFDPSAHIRDGEAPRHKANGGAVARWRGLTAGLAANWVDRTWWNAANPGGAREYVSLPAFLLVNANLAYELAEGLAASLAAFNLLDDRHHEILGAASPARPGHNGEVIGRLVSASLSYGF